MRKIREVIIRNFQSHRDSSFKFDDYTAITGQSDKGKTAIIRAINWVLYNCPNGNSFITRGEDTCFVTVIFNDGLEITRTKGTKENSYDIAFLNGEKLHLEAFGVGSVEAVVEAHGMREIDIFGEKQALNMCKQLDEPFFLGESPTNKASIIGKLAKTEIIDVAIKNTASDIRQKKAISKEYKEKIKAIKAEQAQLKGLSALEKALDYADKKLEALTYLNNKIESIKSIIGKIDYLEQQKDKLKDIANKGTSSLEVIDSLDDAIQVLSTINSIKKTLDLLNMNISKKVSCEDLCSNSEESLTEIIDKIDLIIDSCKEVQSIKLKSSKLSAEVNKLNSLSDIPDEEFFNDISSIVDDCILKMKDISKISEVNNKYKAFSARKERGDSMISNIEHMYSKTLNEYKEALKESGECPTCGSSISDLEHIEKIINEV